MPEETIRSYDGLLHFLKASSKDQVVQCLAVCVDKIHTSNSDDLNNQLAHIIDLSENELLELASSTELFVRTIIYNDCSDPDSLKLLFPQQFDRKLRDLLCKIAIDKIPRWKKAIIENQVSMPKLKSYEYTVESDSSPLKPSFCTLSLQTTEKVESTKVLLDKETLATMIDSLAKIRDQISSVVE